MEIKTEFGLHQKIWIPEIERPGLIIRIVIDSIGVKYQVRYFYNSDAKEVYFLENEIKDKK